MTVPDWQKIAQSRFPEAKQIHGDGEWVAIAQCQSFTVFLYPTSEEAGWKKEWIESFSCARPGHRRHEIMKLNHRMSPGFIYVARCGEFHKIGYSVSPDKRMKQLQTGSPQPVTLVGTISGSPDLEKRWHQTFRDRRVHGEWFKLTREDIDHVLTSEPALFPSLPSRQSQPEKKKKGAPLLKPLNEEEKRQRISQTTKAGLERAKAKGKVLGGPRKLTPAQETSASKMHERGMSFADIGETFGVSHMTIRRILRRHRVAELLLEENFQ